MSMVPTPPDGSFAYVFRMQLDGTFYRFQYKWNPRDTSWYLDIADDKGSATVRNLRMVIGDDILAPHRSLGQDACPQGNLSVIDTSGAGLEALREDLGVRVIVDYVEVA